MYIDADGYALNALCSPRAQPWPYSDALYPISLVLDFGLGTGISRHTVSCLDDSTDKKKMFHDAALYATIGTSLYSSVSDDRHGTSSLALT